MRPIPHYGYGQLISVPAATLAANCGQFCFTLTLID